MNSKRFLIKLQYLGIRYRGVQKQPEHQSIQGKIEQVLVSHLKREDFKTRFSSRTDAMVSSLESFCLLMLEEDCDQELISKALAFLPPDIRILEIKEVAPNFAILPHVKEKEYHYYFSFNEESLHPFCAPYMTLIKEELNLEVMKKGAKLFEGTHNFINYAYKPKPGIDFLRSIDKCEIVENTELAANFFPKNSYLLRVVGVGFMRGQVRLMMGALFRLGMGELSLHDLEKSLLEEDSSFIKWQAPASGLILHKTKLE